MNKDEVLKLALEALTYIYTETTADEDELIDQAITAIKEALAQTEQKYHRGDRLICLETEEYCVIHISGTDRQWVKFPDSHIGVYTNEQVAELFELLPEEPEQEPVAWEQFYPDIGKPQIEQPKQEPVKDWIASHNDICGLLRQAHDALALTSYPPQRTWVGLTDEEITELHHEIKVRLMGTYKTEDIYRAIEAKLKGKNT
jgi:hypothetical protein